MRRKSGGAGSVIGDTHAHARPLTYGDGLPQIGFRPSRHVRPYEQVIDEYYEYAKL